MKPKTVVIDMKSFLSLGKMTDFQWELLKDICAISEVEKTDCSLIYGAYAKQQIFIYPYKKTNETKSTKE